MDPVCDECESKMEWIVEIIDIPSPLKAIGGWVCPMCYVLKVLCELTKAQTDALEQEMRRQLK